MLWLLVCLFVCLIHKVYEAKYKELRTPMPERALHVPAEEGQVLPHCFTNFRPHYNPKSLLDSVILDLNNTQWKIQDYSERKEARLGYKDERPYYEVYDIWKM